MAKYAYIKLRDFAGVLEQVEMIKNYIVRLGQVWSVIN